MGGTATYPCLPAPSTMLAHIGSQRDSHWVDMCLSALLTCQIRLVLPAFPIFPARVRLCHGSPGHLSRRRAELCLGRDHFHLLGNSPVRPEVKPRVLEAGRGARTTLEEANIKQPTSRQGRWWDSKTSEGYGHGVPSFSKDPPHHTWPRSCRAGNPTVLVGKNMGVRGSLTPGPR